MAAHEPPHSAAIKTSYHQRIDMDMPIVKCLRRH